MDYAEWSGETLVKTKDGWVIVSDRFYDMSTNRVLGGTWAETIKGAARPPGRSPG